MADEIGGKSVKDVSIAIAFISGVFTLLGGGWTYLSSQSERGATAQERSVQAYVLSDRAYYETERANCAAIVDYLRDDTPNRLLNDDQKEKVFGALQSGLQSCHVQRPSNQILIERPKIAPRNWVGGGGTSGGGGGGSDY